MLDDLDLVAAAALADWLAGEVEHEADEVGSTWRVPVRTEVVDWLVEATAEERRAYAGELMATDDVGYGSELESVAGLLEGLADLARMARRAGGRLVLTADEG